VPSIPPIHDVVILGSGPAGYTAALYAARANLKPLLLTGLQPGGQLTITTEVENYPGFREPIMGPELMEIMRDQVLRFGTEILPLTVERVDFSKQPFSVWADDGQYFESRTVIVATGASAKLLGIPSEPEFMGFGVSACATCDGFFYKNQRVMVVGGGDTAMEEANYLTRFTSEVVVVHRRDTLRASKIMQDRALRNPKIRFIWNSEILEILGEPHQKVVGVKLRDTTTGAITEHPINGVFVAIGHEPNTQFLKGQLPMDSRGYLQVEPGTARTAIPGVFAAGDVADAVYRQAVTAAGTGCMAAIEAERWLEAQAHEHATRTEAAAAANRPA
jgi:thioredoxin reductase (NADPH)